MDLKEILEQDNFVVMDNHPRGSCTLYVDCIACHPADRDIIREGLKMFFTAKEDQKRDGKQFWFVPSSTAGSRRTK